MLYKSIERLPFCESRDVGGSTRRRDGTGYGTRCLEAFQMEKERRLLLNHRLHFLKSVERFVLREQQEPPVNCHSSDPVPRSRPVSRCWICLVRSAGMLAAREHGSERYP
jgi:hypothetical protein